MAASPSRSSSSTADTKKLAQRSWLPDSAASTGAMSPWPSPALRVAASRARRARPGPTPRARRTAAGVLGAIEPQRARGSGRAVGAERHLVEQADRHRLAAAGLEIEGGHPRLPLGG